MVLNFNHLSSIRQALAGPLPGISAQLSMAPAARKEEVLRFGQSTGSKQAGVLILLYPGANGLTLALTRRTDIVQNHSGQISLPGGAQEVGEDLTQTALRETHEELGIDVTSVEMLGKLTPLHVTTSDFCVHPFAGYSVYRPVFHPDPVEVAELIEVPLELLREPRTVRTSVRLWHDQRTSVPFFQVGRHEIWGATAMILAEFLTITSALSDWM